MAGSSFTVGVAAPIAATFFYGATALRVAAIILGVVVRLSIATVLHLSAQHLLGGLRE
jgi:hypothetical protein